MKYFFNFAVFFLLSTNSIVSCYSSFAKQTRQEKQKVEDEKKRRRQAAVLIGAAIAAIILGNWPYYKSQNTLASETEQEDGKNLSEGDQGQQVERAYYDQEPFVRFKLKNDNRTYSCHLIRELYWILEEDGYWKSLDSGKFVGVKDTCLKYIKKHNPQRLAQIPLVLGLIEATA